MSTIITVKDFFMFVSLLGVRPEETASLLSAHRLIRGFDMVSRVCERQRP